ncbi:endonuclease NucS [Fictibacillus enclensis]|uniref:endonuclease NucS domain-containing protein n=1 Tax=Fictibacillus enclensis TaxID=1017270 RepID=UPI0025A03008|nr:endonuclease NucS domain-containing protein [Fictibacillus enclensis]MDM5336399.1 endonuclease NucS [Fictibacillus enclensis]
MYRLNPITNELEEVLETSFYKTELKERQHIEEWIRKNPEVLGEDLLVIGHEYDQFEVNERLDLLALDREGNLVIIEVKRDTTGSNVDYQALKYASYCARLTPQDILNIYVDYLRVHTLEIDAKDSMLEFLNLDSDEELNTILNNNQRIIIVGKEIDKRILSVCTWLYEKNIDIKCITIKPYKIDNHIIIDTNQIIPPYKLEDYYISKKAVAKERQIRIDQSVTEFLQRVSDFINSKTDYRVRYGGKRDYFGGRQFLGLPWYFIFAYKKKDNIATMFIESDKEQGVELIKKASEKIDELRNLLGHEVELTRGTRNTELFKLIVKVNFNQDQSIDSCVEQFTTAFVRYKKFLEQIV